MALLLMELVTVDFFLRPDFFVLVVGRISVFLTLIILLPPLVHLSFALQAVAVVCNDTEIVIDNFN